MNYTDIIVGMKTTLSASVPAGLNIRWPRDEAPALPRGEVEFVGGEFEHPAMDGDIELVRATMQVTITTDFDLSRQRGDREANEFADAIKSVFSFGDRISITGGEITIIRPTRITGGFEDKDKWRVPVLIGFEANSA